MVTISDLLKKPDLSASDLNKMKHADLKQICKEKGLSVTGTKSDLIARFLKSLNPNADSTVQDVQDVAEEDLVSSQTKDVMSDCTTFEVTESQSSSAIPESKENESIEPPEKKQKFTKIEAPVSNDSLEQKKLEERVKRFGTVNEEQRKMARAERFQTGSNTNTSTASSTDDVLKKRAERFNLSPSEPLANSTTNNEEALKKRMARFGQAEEQQQQQPASSTDASSVFAKRMAKFGRTQTSDEAKQKRAQRFGLN